MTKVIVGVPTISYGRQMIRDIMQALDGYKWEAIKIDTRKLTMRIDDVEIYIVCTNDHDKFEGLHGDYAFGLTSIDTAYITKGKQTESVFYFSGLIDYLRSVLDQN